MTIHLAIDQGISEELQEIEKNGLFRKLRRIDGSSDSETIVEGNIMHLFSTNNYLGLATNPRLIAKAIEAIKQYGTSSGGSRLTTGNFALHEQLETKLAQFKGTASALLFSSGYLANVGTISSLMGEGDLILSDALNHASIIDGCRLSKAKTVVYDHVNMDDLAEKLRIHHHYRRKLIITDGVFSMDGNIAPLPQIVNLAEKYNAFVMVDDAHATGVLGKNGAGTAEHFGLTGKVQLSMGTLSKAVGSEGGFVAASSQLVTYLRNKARSFIFQTSLSPGIVAASIEGIDMIQRESKRRDRLLENAARLRNGLADLGFSIIGAETPIIAVIIGDAQAASHFAMRLEEGGIYAPAIRPPTVPEGKSRIRLTVMATHTKEQINDVLNCFKKIGLEMGVIK